MSIRCSSIIESFCHFSHDVWPEKVESTVTLLTMHLSAFKLDYVSKVKSDSWFALASYF